MKRLPAILLLLLLLLTLSAAAQERPAFSPVLSFDFGSPLFLNRNPSTLNASDTTLTGTSSGETYGIGLSWEIPSFFSSQWSLQTNLSARYSVGKFVGGGRNIAGNEWKAALEVCPAWTSGPLDVRLGPWLSTRLSGLVLEDNIDVADSGTLSSRTHVGLLGGVGWRFGNFPIEPELHASLDLTEVGRAGFNAMSLGLSLTIPLQSSSEHDTNDHAIESRSSARPVPSRIRFLVNRSELARTVPLEREEVRVKQYTMLDPVIRIDSDANEFFSRRGPLKEYFAGPLYRDTAHFSLADNLLPDIRQNILGLYASRVRQDPAARLDARVIALSQGLECEQALHWLFDTLWGVGKQVRIRSAVVEDHIGPDTAYVALSSNDPSISAPLVTQWILQSYHLPHLALSCEVDRDAWAVIQVSPRTTPGNHSVTGDPCDAPVYHRIFLNNPHRAGLTYDTTINLEQDRDWVDDVQHLNSSDANMIVAELISHHPPDSVRGIPWQQDTARDTLLLPRVDTSRTITTIVRKQFRFFLSDNFQQYEHGTEALELLLRRIKELLAPGVQITILESDVGRTTARHLDLLSHLRAALGPYGNDFSPILAADVSAGVMLVIEL